MDWADQYNFDPAAQITEGDLFYMPATRLTAYNYENYTLYYYDVDAHTLYFIHSNL